MELEQQMVNRLHAIIRNGTLRFATRSIRIREREDSRGRSRGKYTTRANNRDINIHCRICQSKIPYEGFYQTNMSRIRIAAQFLGANKIWLKLRCLFLLLNECKNVFTWKNISIINLYATRDIKRYNILVLHFLAYLCGRKPNCVNCSKV